MRVAEQEPLFSFCQPDPTGTGQKKITVCSANLATLQTFKLQKQNVMTILQTGEKTSLDTKVSKPENIS